LLVDDAAITERFLASLNREVVKAKRVAKGLAQFSDEQLLKELRKRSGNYDIYHPDANLYDQFADELQNETITALQEEVDALSGELATLKMHLPDVEGRS
jgi:ribosomal protein L29